MIRTLLPGAALLAAAAGAVAADTTPPVHSLFLSVLAGQHGIDNSRDSTGAANIADGTGAALAIGYRFTPGFALELAGGRTRTSLDRPGGRDVDIDSIRFDGSWYLPPGDWQPYLVAGIGTQTFDNGPFDMDETVASAGLGVLRNLGDNFNLRLDARAVHPLGEDALDYQLLAGVTVTFGGD